MFQNIVEFCNSVFTPVFTDPKIVLKMGVVGNADLCVFWTRELKGNLEHRAVQVSGKIEIQIQKPAQNALQATCGNNEN